MGLYLDIAQVDSKESPRRLFSCNMNMKFIMLMIMMLLLYNVGYVNEHETFYVCICDDDYLWCKLYKAKYYLWSPILFT